MRTRAVSSSPRAHSILLYAAAPRASGRHGNRCETTTMVKPRATYVRSSGVSCRSECCPGCEKPSQPTVPRGSRSSPTAQGSKPPKPVAVRGSSRPGPQLDLPMTYRPPSRGSRLVSSQGPPCSSQVGRAAPSAVARKFTGVAVRPDDPWRRLALLGPDRSLGALQTYRVGQSVDVVGPVVAPAVEEEGRSARDSAEIGAVDVLGDPVRAGAAVQVSGEARHVQAELGGVVRQVPRQQRPLMVEQEVVHCPEGALACGCF